MVWKVAEQEVQDQMEQTMARQALVEEIVSDVMRIKDEPAPPRVLYGLVMGWVTGRGGMTAGRDDQPALRLSRLWTARTAADLRRFAADTQRLLNSLHRHLLVLFLNHAHWLSSHSHACDHWFEHAHDLSLLPEIQNAPPQLQRRESRPKIFRPLPPC